MSNKTNLQSARLEAMGIDVWRLRGRSNTSTVVSSEGEADEAQARAVEPQRSVDDRDLSNVSSNEPARAGSLELTLLKSRSSTDRCGSTARACASSASPSELTTVLVFERPRRRQTSMPMASSRALCKFVLFDMPFDAPCAHAAFFRFLLVFFELCNWLFFWLFSAFMRSSIRLAFHRSFKRTINRTHVAPLIVICESLNGLRESFVKRSLGIIK